MKRICLGKIVAAHGVKGLVKILPFGDDVSLLAGELYSAETGEDTLHITLKNGLGKYILAEIEGVNDRNAAENIRGSELYIERKALPEIEGGFYFEDLIGRTAMDEKGENIGKIINADNYGASDLIEIQGPRGTFMLPFIDAYICEVKDDAVIIKDFEPFL